MKRYSLALLLTLVAQPLVAMEFVRKFTKKEHGDEGTLLEHGKVADTDAIFKAAEKNDVKLVKKLLKKGISPDVCKEDGLSLLSTAIQAKANKVIQLLVVEQRADVNKLSAPSSYQLCSPLHTAVKNNNYEIIPLLIKNGAKLCLTKEDIKNSPKKIILHNVLSYSWGAEDVLSLKQLLLVGVPFKQMDDGIRVLMVLANPFLKVVMMNDDQQAKNVATLLSADKKLVNQPDEFGATPLMYAAAQGYADTVNLLLANGADKKAKDKQGLTAADIVAEIIGRCDDDAVRTNYNAIFKALEAKNTPVLPTLIVATAVVLGLPHKN